MNAYINIDCEFREGKKEVTRRMDLIAERDRDAIEREIKEMLDYIFGERSDIKN